GRGQRLRRPREAVGVRRLQRRGQGRTPQGARGCRGGSRRMAVRRNLGGIAQPHRSADVPAQALPLDRNTAAAIPPKPYILSVVEKPGRAAEILTRDLLDTKQ